MIGSGSDVILTASAISPMVGIGVALGVMAVFGTILIVDGVNESRRQREENEEMKKTLQELIDSGSSAEALEKARKLLDAMGHARKS
jgi:hypothetical protein